MPFFAESKATKIFFEEVESQVANDLNQDFAWKTQESRPRDSLLNSSLLRSPCKRLKKKHGDGPKWVARGIWDERLDSSVGYEYERLPRL